MDLNNRCKWCHSDPIYIKYHDKEWGVPVFNDRKLFEALTLETFQAGLSWLTILKKRTNFKMAFDNFDVQKISKYSQMKRNFALISIIGSMSFPLKSLP